MARMPNHISPNLFVDVIIDVCPNRNNYLAKKCQIQIWKYVICFQFTTDFPLTYSLHFDNAQKLK